MGLRNAVVVRNVMIMKKQPSREIPEHVRSIATMLANSWLVMFSADFILRLMNVLMGIVGYR